MRVKSVQTGVSTNGTFRPTAAAVKTKANPLPVGRLVAGKVRRLPNGDIQLLIEKKNPASKKKKKKSAPKKKAKKATRKGKKPAAEEKTSRKTSKKR